MFLFFCYTDGEICFNYYFVGFLRGLLGKRVVIFGMGLFENVVSDIDLFGVLEWGGEEWILVFQSHHLWLLPKVFLVQKL